MPKTKVFLTWSGERSKAVADALRNWLPLVIQSVEPWMSENDCDKGTRWNSEIAIQLEESKIGIICLTPENLEKPWVNFEAGALSKIANSYACTYLFGLKATDVKDPLSQFNHTIANRSDTKKLLGTINKRFGNDSLGDTHLDKLFDMCWPELETKLAVISKLPTTSQAPVRSDREVQEEILSTVRNISKNNEGIAGTVLAELRAFIIRAEGLEHQNARAVFEATKKNARGMIDPDCPDPFS
jgi:hypothetical protein